MESFAVSILVFLHVAVATAAVVVVVVVVAGVFHGLFTRRYLPGEYAISDAGSSIRFMRYSTPTGRVFPTENLALTRSKPCKPSLAFAPVLPCCAVVCAFSPTEKKKKNGENVCTPIKPFQSLGSFCRAVGSWHDPDPDLKVPPELAAAFKQILQVISCVCFERACVRACVYVGVCLWRVRFFLFFFFSVLFFFLRRSSLAGSIQPS